MVVLKRMKISTMKGRIRLQMQLSDEEIKLRKSFVDIDVVLRKLP